MPKFPAYDTLTGRALALLLEGRKITHRDFQNHVASYRLSSDIHILRGLGWPISDRWEVAKTKDKTGRNAKYKRYFFEQKVLLSLKKEDGERLSKFIEAVMKFEGRTPSEQ